VRDTPYTTDGATPGDQLMPAGRGNCVAMAEYLLEAFRSLGVERRRVRWLHRLPDQPAEVALLPTPFDVQTALEVRRGNRWSLVDAAHAPALAAAGLTVASWDATAPTPPAHPRPGHCGDPATRPPSHSRPAIPSPTAGRTLPDRLQPPARGGKAHQTTPPRRPNTPLPPPTAHRPRPRTTAEPSRTEPS
jgi:hypothetical protein